MTRHPTRQLELGAFLRERRARITPADAGLIAGPPRRTPGLRREEIAQLAGLSAGYYARLEQGQAAHPSASVIEALIRILRLSAEEARHLRALAGEPTPTARETVSRSALRAMELLKPPTAALVLGRIGDVLAWNESAPRLFPGRLPQAGERSATRPNNARYVFCDPRSREIFPNWSEVADDTVAHLRGAAGHLVDDPGFRALVDELLEVSPDFAARWSRREVRRHVSGEKHLDHPEFGRLTVDYEVLAVLDEPDQFLVIYGLEDSWAGDVEKPGSASTS
ncbi:helix-turn-helix transcriptional regulator [Kribbella sp. NPDC051586]|uniref:helix-turn-helix transcriptional regulator n=1 Tax=Kribbella sp. NPDC051586 TaxID=3364118 RepID=UPI00378F459B